MSAADVAPVVQLHDAALRFGERTVWSGLNLDVAPGEFVAVLGPNGSGKTSLLKVLLGLQRLTSGAVEVGGSSPSRGSRSVGYVPQQKGFDRDVPLRGRDLVALGLDGHRWGVPLPSRARRGRVDAALADVGAQRYAKAAVGRLSGGEQQRLRMAQALLGDPALLLCDEPLLSLDLHHQRVITELVDRRRREHGTAVLFVTHEVNPVLPLVDRVLYLAEGRWASGAPDEVLTSERLSALYGTPVEVVRIGGRVIVAGTPDAVHAEPGGSHHHPDDSAGAIPR
ncbi:MAG TPA: ABC transporter ATP-binding protein [Mycobacteriales bacterium]|nr:ABC transporter ATP-binding protein [Mycobacteriales bacterium]